MEHSARKTIILGDLLDAGEALIQTGPFGSQLHSHDYKLSGVPVVPTEAIGHRRLKADSIPKISVEKAAELKRHRLHAGDILFARRGVQATGYSAIVESQHDGWLCGTGAILLRISVKSIDPVFLSFYLSSSETIAWLRANAVGAVMPNLNEGVLRRLPLTLPPLNEQQRIAQILGELDDKIELNRRTNETLEATAGAIFNLWFVDVNPVSATTNASRSHAKVPQEWHSGALGDFAEISKDAVDPTNHPEETFDHYSLPSFDQGKRPSRDSGSSIKSNKFVVHDNCVLLSKLNPRIPRVWLPFLNRSRRSISSTEFLVLRPKNDIPREFIYGLVSSSVFFDVFATLVTGTSGSHQRVNPDSVLAMTTVVPPPSVIKEYSDAVRPMLKRIELNILEAERLAIIRAALLPKLLSGELSVTSHRGRP